MYVYSVLILICVSSSTALMMNSTERAYSPSDSTADSNLAFTIIFTIISSLSVGAVVTPVILLKNLRSQPYQFLVSNCLTSSLANVLGSGIYRTIQMIKYNSQGFEATARDTNCIVTSFSQFPFVVSNYCLFLIGLERFIFLQSKPRMPVDWYSLFVFVVTPWALGITRYSVILGDSATRYINIPYLGICVDITSERDGRRIVHFIFDIVIPVLLAVVTYSLAIGRAYSDYNEIKAKLTYDLASERSQLEKEKRQVLKTVKDLYLPVTLLAVKLIAIIVITLLYREYSRDNSQQHKDAVATAGLLLLLFEPCALSIVSIVLNFDLRREVQIYIPCIRSPLVSPDSAEEIRDDMESPDTSDAASAAAQPPDVATVKENVATTAV